MYLSAVIDINWVCRGLSCVATTRNVGQDLATFGDVGDMSATRRRHVELRSTIDDRVEKTKLFDVIIDKGLLDALLCGDGFDIQQFMSGINDTLIPNNWDLQILICFPKVSH